MRGQVNHHIVVGRHRRVMWVQDVEIRAAREVVRVEETAYVESQIATTAGHQNFHISRVLSKVLRFVDRPAEGTGQNPNSLKGSQPDGKLTLGQHAFPNQESTRNSYQKKPRLPCWK